MRVARRNDLRAWLRHLPICNIHSETSVLPPNRPLFVDILSSFVKSAKYTRHELDEYVAPVCEAESTTAFSNPAVRALDLAHLLAFRNGLGSSPFTTPGTHVSVEDVKAYAQNAFTPGNLAVLGTGIDAATLQKLVEQSLGSLSGASTLSSSPSSYFGGETRIEAHGAPETIFIGFGTSGAPSAELAVLSAHLDPTPAIKWSKGLSPIAANLPEGVSVRSVLLPYSDAALYGIVIQGADTERVKEAGKVAVAALKASGDLKGDDLKKAIAKAKFNAASALDGRDNTIFALGTQVRPNHMNGEMLLTMRRRSARRLRLTARSTASTKSLRLRTTR